MTLHPSLLRLTGLLILGFFALPALAANDRPNIVVILVDDMGFSDIGCYGSEIDTPNLDALAAGGLRFTQFYNTGRCCPTRASLLTGLYSHQAGVGHMNGDDGVPGFIGHLNDRCQTLGEVMHTAGYFTAASGKWHVGPKDGQLPCDRGFDRFFGSRAGGIYFDLDTGSKRDLMLNHDVIASTNAELPEGFYSTHAFVDYGIRFIDEAIEQDKPFLLYLAYVAPHFPLQAPPATIDKYRGRYRAGWDALSKQRQEKQIALGLIDAAWTPAPRADEIAAWDALSDAEKDRFDQIMSVYAAAVDEMDQSTGRLIEALRERGELDNTIIFFMSDNGGNAESGPNGRLNLKDTTPYPGGPGSNIFCGQSWAGMQNTPFRFYKHYVHEGGIATPLIIHYPAGIDPKLNGSWVTSPNHLIDIMATCVDLSGARYPEKVDGRDIHPLEGRSLAPAFAGAELPEDRPLFWEHEGNRAVRVGDWKLVARGINGKWELYNLADDRTELHDLATQQPDHVAELANLWEQWAHHASVFPLPRRKAWLGRDRAPQDE